MCAAATSLRDRVMCMDRDWAHGVRGGWRWNGDFVRLCVRVRGAPVWSCISAGAPRKRTLWAEFLPTRRPKSRPMREKQPTKTFRTNNLRPMRVCACRKLAARDELVSLVTRCVRCYAS